MLEVLPAEEVLPMSDFFFGYDETELIRTGTTKRGPWYLAHFLSKRARLPAKSFCGVRVIKETPDGVHPSICLRCVRVKDVIERRLRAT